MTGIKGVGRGVVEAILQERTARGRFKSLWDFVQRIDHKKVGKKGCESLIDAGAFDFTGWSRDQLLVALDPTWESASKDQKDKSAGFLSLFSLMGDTEASRFETPPKV